MRNLLAAAALAASTLVLTLAGTGCAPATYKTSQIASAGDKGALSFKYDSCIVDCALDQPALQGAAVTIDVRKGAPNAGLSVRVANRALATISSQSYTCAASDDCHLIFELDAKQEGDAKLEVVDKSGALVDGIPLHIKAAARIDIDVEGREAGSDGVYVVKQGERIAVASKVFDNDRTELFFSHHGVSQVYANKGIVGPDETAIFGSTDVEDAIANGVGETTLTTRAVGAESIVKFRVTK